MTFWIVFDVNVIIFGIESEVVNWMFFFLDALIKKIIQMALNSHIFMSEYQSATLRVVYVHFK